MHAVRGSIKRAECRLCGGLRGLWGHGCIRTMRAG